MRKWVKGKEAEDYDQLFNLFPQEQFLSISTEEVRNSWWDKSIKSVLATATLVDALVQAQKEEHKPGVKGGSCFTPGQEDGVWEPRHSLPQKWKSSSQAS